MSTDPLIVAADEATRRVVIVATAVDYKDTAAYVMQCKTLLREIESAFDEPIKAAHKAHKSAIAAKDKYHKAVKAKLDEARRAMSAWASAEESKRLAAQAVVMDEAAQQSQAHAAGDSLAVCAPIVPTTVPEVAGIQRRKVWRYKIVDESLVPREYLMVDVKKVAGVVKSLRAQANIPGVHVWQEVQVV